MGEVTGVRKPGFIEKLRKNALIPLRAVIASDMPRLHKVAEAARSKQQAAPAADTATKSGDSADGGGVLEPKVMEVTLAGSGAPAAAKKGDGMPEDDLRWYQQLNLLSFTLDAVEALL